MGVRQHHVANRAALPITYSESEAARVDRDPIINDQAR
jgi:hypothetical protein